MTTRTTNPTTPPKDGFRQRFQGHVWICVNVDGQCLWARERKAEPGETQETLNRENAA